MRTFILALLLVQAPTLHAAAQAPDEAVRAALQELVELVGACRLPLAADPIAVRGIPDQYIRPRIDVLYASQLILGRHWSEAGPELRRRFGEALFGSLASRYSSALLLLTPATVTVSPPGTPPAEGEATVEVLAQAGLAAPIPVSLQMRRSSGPWRVFDARWEGQSYVLSLRQAVGQEIRRDGLEAVVRRLETSAGEPVGPPGKRQTAAGRCLRARESEG